MLDSRAQHVDHASLGDFALQAVEELGALGPLVFDAEGGELRRLRGAQEREQLGQVNGMIAVVVF